MNGKRVLDLFCKAGGASMGYYAAGFYVVGVDIEPQPHYPFELIQMDAFAVLHFLSTGYTLHGFALEDFDFIHASPVCKGYSVSSLSHRRNGRQYPDQIPELREALAKTGVPYVIENVPGAPLESPVVLCGSQFGLGADVEGTWGTLVRHRLFEATFEIADAGPHAHGSLPITVAGHGQPSWTRQHGYGPVRVSHWRDAMGIGWMNRNELNQAIPPAYAEYVGGQFLASLAAREPLALAA